MEEPLYQRAIEYHRRIPAGKIGVALTKPLSTHDDLALAYSPGVAAISKAIHADPQEATFLTARANLIAVITNGSSVLGLGNIGPLAAKPVMEGKAAIFRKFAGINVFDLEINEADPQKLVDIIASLEPTFGGVNLEDIKAPECFYIEKELKKRLKIPVFHDDQHGTAIIVAAAALGALTLVNKPIGSIKLVVSGAGAAALTCIDMLIALGLRKDNVLVVDQAGVIYEGRAERMDPSKERYATSSPLRTLAEALEGADFFLGLSAGGLVSGEMIAKMAQDPIVFALANPLPEILPEEVKRIWPGAIVATGRSDYPNQVNNALCFPFIFRGALDVGATTINTEMALACIHALVHIAQQGSPSQMIAFGPDYLIPDIFDTRLLVDLPIAVAKAAMESGVATRPIQDLDTYQQSLTALTHRLAHD